jgi:hypothetical protein
MNRSEAFRKDQTFLILSHANNKHSLIGEQTGFCYLESMHIQDIKKEFNNLMNLKKRISKNGDPNQNE